MEAIRKEQSSRKAQSVSSMAKRVRPRVRIYRAVQAAGGGGSAAMGEGVEDSKVKWWTYRPSGRTRG